MRKPFICGNWKMHKTCAEAVALVRELRSRLSDTQAQVAVAPPFTALASVKSALVGSPIQVYAQNGHEAKQGAFTGEVSYGMLAEVGCEGVIIGHSERRALFHESDELVKKKLESALAAGLLPIVCIGETLDEREANRTWEVVSRQVRAALTGVDAASAEKVTLAYEPVWAIGTGKTATSGQAQEVHALIRGLVRELCGAKVAEGMRIQYGGSVKPENAAELLGQPDVDGALVGGASLKADDFARIVAGAKKN